MKVADYIRDALLLQIKRDNKDYDLPSLEAHRPNEWQGHQFTAREIDELRNGDTIYIPDAVSARSNRLLRCTLCYTQVNGKKKLVPVRV